MISRASVADLDYLVNHPRIFPSTGVFADQEISMAAVYDRPGNVAFRCPHGAMVFGDAGDGVFESHFLFIPGSPAKEIKRYAKAMLNEMFTNHGARVIKGKPPRSNRAVRVIGTAIGYQKIPNSGFVDDLGRDCELYEIRREQWQT